MKHICIYCKQEKEETDFNTEHVIPQMFGTYPGKAPVLNQYQVCRECNSFFSRELEDKIALDSIEALSRMQYGTKRISDGRQLRGKRLKVEISEGILKGISPQIVSNNNSPERIEFQYNKLIGLHKGGERKRRRDERGYPFGRVPFAGQPGGDDLDPGVYHLRGACQMPRPLPGDELLLHERLHRHAAVQRLFLERR